MNSSNTTYGESSSGQVHILALSMHVWPEGETLLPHDKKIPFAIGKHGIIPDYKTCHY